MLDVHGDFDTIICTNVLEHIEDDTSVLRHLLSLLRPAGTLFLLVPAHPRLYSTFDKAAGHYRRYSKHDVARIVARISVRKSISLTQFYFNPIGALGYFIMYMLLSKLPHASARKEIGLFDRWLVPLAKLLQSKCMPFGISLVSIIERRDNSPLSRGL